MDSFLRYLLAMTILESILTYRAYHKNRPKEFWFQSGVIVATIGITLAYLMELYLWR